MLDIDDASMHKIPEIKRSVELNEAKVMMIPGGLTWYLLPFDVLFPGKSHPHPLPTGAGLFDKKIFDPPPISHI